MGPKQWFDQLLAPGSDGERFAYNAGDSGSISGWEDPPEEGMATYSSILAWRIPWIEEPGRLQSMGSQGVRHDWACMHIMEIRLKSKNRTPYDPEISLLGIYPEKTIIQKDTCAPMFTAARFTVAKTWKWPSCPVTCEWIKTLWYVYTMEYYQPQ